MYPISARYQDAIATGTAGLKAIAALWSGGMQTGLLNVIDGSVTVSRTQAQRRACSLTLALGDHDAIIPAANGAGIASPFGAEVRPYFGIDYPDGTSEFVPMGVFAVTDLTLTDTVAGLTAVLAGYDRSWIVAERKLRHPYKVADAQNVAAAATSLIDSVYAGLSYNITPTPAVTSSPGPTFAENDDVWASATKLLASSAGFAAFFDLTGTVVGQPTPDPASQPVVWDFVEGASCTVTTFTRRLTRQGVANDFVAVGTGSKIQPPVRAEVLDSDPNSVTDVTGAFGYVPLFASSALIASAADATAAAQHLATITKGKSEVLTITTTPNPAFDIDDVVFVRRTRIGVDGLYVIDAVTHTLRHDGVTTLTLRRVA